MVKRSLLLLTFVMALTGCASPPMDLANSTDHPANPNASEARMPAASKTLAVASANETPLASEQLMHDMQPMTHDMAGMQMAAPMVTPATSQAAVIYTCPMHPEVLSDKPGKCPKCGMALVIKAKQGAGK